MKRVFLKASKWGLRLFLVIILLVILDVAVLAFPYPVFPNKIEFENFTLYSDGDLDSGYIDILADVKQRNGAMDIFRLDHAYRIFLCRSQKLYSFFAFLCRKKAETQGVVLSQLNSIYISEPRVAYMKSISSSNPTHSFLDGNLAGAIGHEVGHLDLVAAIGFGNNLSLPFWKSEGYADYAAHIMAARAVSGYDLRKRIALLYDHNFWGDKHSLAYRIFESQLMIEFLYDIKGYDFETIMSPEVTSALVLKEMYTWYSSE